MSSPYCILYAGDCGVETIGISKHAEKRMLQRFRLLHPKYEGTPDVLAMIRRMFLKYRYKRLQCDDGISWYIPCAEFGLYYRNGMILTIVIRRQRYKHLNAA